MNATRIIRRLRQRIFDYYEESEEKGLKASALIDKLKERAYIERRQEEGRRWAQEFRRATPERRSDMLMESIGFFRSTD